MKNMVVHNYSTHSSQQNFLGEIRMTPIFAFNYGISFAVIAAVIVHTVLYQGENHASRKGSECYCL